MNGYEKIVSMMKQSGGDSSSPITLGEMKDNTVCKIGKLELDPDDYFINADIKDKLKEGDSVVLIRYTEDKYIILAKVV